MPFAIRHGSPNPPGAITAIALEYDFFESGALHVLQVARKMEAGIRERNQLNDYSVGLHHLPDCLQRMQ